MTNVNHEEHFDDCWQIELQGYLDYKNRYPESKFYDAYVDKWATLQGLIERIKPIVNLSSSTRCLELGAGAATISILLALEGCLCKSVDTSKYAKIFAEKVSEEVGTIIEYEITDFFDEKFINSNSLSFDFVSSTGVIEHFSREQQLEFLKLNRSISKKWVLVAIPNSDGEIYKSYIRWAKKNGNFYDIHHEDCKINDLKELIVEVGMTPVLIDGFFVFFAKEEMYGETSTEMNAIHKKLSKSIVEAGGNKYSRYPRMDFTPNDISVLKKAENSLSESERIKMGFMNFILAKVS